jgi:hypothetical protein
MYTNCTRLRGKGVGGGWVVVVQDHVASTIHATIGLLKALFHFYLE